MGESTPQTSENAGIGTVEEVPYMGDTTALRTTCSECEYGGVTKHLSRRQAEKALTEHYAAKHSSPTERDECGGCLCPTEHDGDYGSSGHPGPCPPHTCGLSVPPEIADMPVPTVTPVEQRRENCSVARFGRPHRWIVGAFYWPLGSTDARLYEGDDYAMCGSCGQIEPEFDDSTPPGGQSGG